MAGISSRAITFDDPVNKKKYQNYELLSDFDINFYESFYRTHDPQLGQFRQIDSKVDSFFSCSPYVSMLNNPIKFTDFLGDIADTTSPKRGYVPAPKTLPGFPNAGKRSWNPKSERYRWKLPDQSILEWDKQHGEVEKYDKTGKKHQGAFDPNTGELIKDPVPGRTTPKINSALDPSEPPRAVQDNLIIPKDGRPATPEPLNHVPPQASDNKSLEQGVKTRTVIITLYIIWKLGAAALTIGTGGAASPLLAL